MTSGDKRHIRIQEEAMGVPLGHLHEAGGQAELPVRAEHRQRRDVPVALCAIGTVLNLRTTTSQKCESVPRRARF